MMTKTKQTDAERTEVRDRNKQLRTKFPKLWAALRHKKPPKSRVIKPTRSDDSGNLPPAA